MGENFKKDYQSSQDKNHEIQLIMFHFEYIIHLQIGTEDIASAINTQTLIINRSMKIDYDALLKDKGKDAKKFLTLSMKQHKKRSTKNFAEQMGFGKKTEDEEKH